MRRGGVLRTLLTLLAVSGCAIAPPASPLPDDPDGELRELDPTLRILAVPQSEVTGLLGAVIDPQTGAPLPTRRMLIPRSTETYGRTTYSGLRELSRAAGVVVASDFASADVGWSDFTHLSYDVSIDRSRYLVGEPIYDPRSRCCRADGSVAPECAAGVVSRVYVGSGHLAYLRVADAQAGFEAGPVEVYGGSAYRVERERGFTLSVFAIEVSDAASFCENALCDAREGQSCARCRVIGAQSDLESVDAPATGIARLVCDDMPLASEVVATVRGAIHVEDCYEDAHAVLSVEVRGARTDTWTLAEPLSTDPSLVLARETPRVSPSEDGTVSARLDLVECRCGQYPTRCRIDPDLELAIETVR